MKTKINNAINKLKDFYNRYFGQKDVCNNLNQDVKERTRIICIVFVGVLCLSAILATMSFNENNETVDDNQNHSEYTDTENKIENNDKHETNKNGSSIDKYNSNVDKEYTGKIGTTDFSDIDGLNGTKVTTEDGTYDIKEYLLNGTAVVGEKRIMTCASAMNGGFMTRSGAIVSVQNGFASFSEIDKAKNIGLTEYGYKISSDNDKNADIYINNFNLAYPVGENNIEMGAIVLYINAKKNLGISNSNPGKLIVNGIEVNGKEVKLESETTFITDKLYATILFDSNTDEIIKEGIDSFKISMYVATEKGKSKSTFKNKDITQYIYDILSLTKTNHKVYETKRCIENLDDIIQMIKNKEKVEKDFKESAKEDKNKDKDANKDKNKDTSISETTGNKDKATSEEGKNVAEDNKKNTGSGASVPNKNEENKKTKN